MPQPAGLQSAFEANRDGLLRYLRAHGAGDFAEDLLHELWLRTASGATGPIASPLNYLYRAATNLMIDHRRSLAQRRARDQEWSDLADRLSGAVESGPGPDREVAGRTMIGMVEKALAALPPRAVSIFREHRLAGRTQREIAAGMGLSASTIESDLRLVYAALDELKRRFDEEEPPGFRLPGQEA